MSELVEGPAYVISDKGVSYEDGWCYGPSRFLGRYGDDDDARALIHSDIRKAWSERNGLPLYYLSDHGNLHKSRAIRLRSKEAR
jgi:hypothetical protein